MPRFAQRLVILFFWPIRASSANQISMSAGSMPFSRAISSRRAPNFFERLDCAFGLRVMARAGRELAVAHGPQLPAQGLLGHTDAELLQDPLREIDQPPAHDAMDRRDRTTFDHFRDRGPVRVVQPRGLSGRLAVDQTIRPIGVELHHPVPHDLQRDTADPGGIGARRTVIDRRKRQKPPCLRCVLRLAGKRPQLRRLKITS